MSFNRSKIFKVIAVRSMINFERELNRSPGTRQSKQGNLCLSTCLWNHNATSTNNRASWISSRVWRGGWSNLTRMGGLQSFLCKNARLYPHNSTITHTNGAEEKDCAGSCSHSRRHLRITTRATRFSQPVTLSCEISVYSYVFSKVSSLTH